MKTKTNVLAVVSIAALFSLGYAIMRYNIFGSVPWKDLPLYIMNKAISFTAIILFTISYSIKYQNKPGTGITQKSLDRRIIIEITSSLIMVHVLMSLLLFKPAIFAKFFAADGTISLYAGLSMIAGIMAFALLWGYKLNSLSNKKNKKPLLSLHIVVNGAMLCTVTHLFFMGYKGWITPDKWNGGMPPISLVAFLIASFGLILKLFRTFGRTAEPLETIMVESGNQSAEEINEFKN